MGGFYKEKIPHVEQIKLKPLQGILSAAIKEWKQKKTTKTIQAKPFQNIMYFLVLLDHVKQNFSICTTLKSFNVMITQKHWLKKLNTAALHSHTANGSNLRSLALQAKTLNNCSKKPIYNSQRFRGTAILCHCSNFWGRVKCFLHYFNFKESDKHIPVSLFYKPVLIAGKYKELFCFKLHIQITRSY